jgi:hypothetical protein
MNAKLYCKICKVIAMAWNQGEVLRAVKPVFAVPHFGVFTLVYVIVGYPYSVISISFKAQSLV